VVEGGALKPRDVQQKNPLFVAEGVKEGRGSKGLVSFWARQPFEKLVEQDLIKRICRGLWGGHLYEGPGKKLAREEKKHVRAEKGQGITTAQVRTNPFVAGV